MCLCRWIPCTDQYVVFLFGKWHWGGGSVPAPELLAACGLHLSPGFPLWSLAWLGASRPCHVSMGRGVSAAPCWSSDCPGRQPGQIDTDFRWPAGRLHPLCLWKLTSEYPVRFSCPQSVVRPHKSMVLFSNLSRPQKPSLLFLPHSPRPADH